MKSNSNYSKYENYYPIDKVVFINGDLKSEEGNSSYGPSSDMIYIKGGIQTSKTSGTAISIIGKDIVCSKNSDCIYIAKNISS